MKILAKVRFRWGILVGLVAVLVFCPFFWPYIFAPAAWVAGRAMEFTQRRPFDAEVWRHPPRGETAYRERMLSDLFRKHHLVGMSHTQITNLLGAPESTTLFGETNIEYRLAPAFLDYRWLIIDFDTNAIVSGYDVAHD